MKSAPTKLLIVARPGRFIESLQALLFDKEQIEIVGQVGDGPELEETIAQTRPVLILLDVHLASESYQTVLARLRTRYPHIRRLVLISSPRQQAIAHSAGADGVLLKGFIISDLLRAIKALIS